MGAFKLCVACLSAENSSALGPLDIKVSEARRVQ